MTKILFIDNRDSFAYNIVELLRTIGITPTIITDTRQPHTTPPPLTTYHAIILSPGAGIPDEYPIMQQILAAPHHIPILGICLGHQAIAQQAGATLTRLPHPLHGHTSTLRITTPAHPIFRNIPPHTPIARYHSWTIDPDSVPNSQIQTIATDEQGNIQAISHRHLPRIGLQFHPESIITTHGPQIITNWLSIVNKKH